MTPRAPRPKSTAATSIDDLRRENEELRAALEEFRSAREEHRFTEQRLSAVIEHAPIVVFAVDRDGIFTLSEGRGLQSLGLEPGQVVGMSAFDIYRDFPPIVANIKECLSGKPVNAVVHVGALVFESLYVPRRDDGGDVVGISGVAWDVTDRVRAEENADHLSAQLQQAQKMETIGTLAGGIAHDFNNILSPILGYTDLALSELPASHPAHDDLEQVLKAARRARELVQQILIFSRRSDQVKRPVQLHLVIHEALKLIRSTLPSTIELSQHVETRDDTVLADPGQMHQVIMNLCTNAASAMRASGGVLRVELSKEVVDAATRERVAGLEPGPHVVLSVSDQGEGMDDATRARVFEPFFTTKKPGEGTGLGLSVVHGIVHSHGGGIEVTSRPGQGATFRVYLPCAPAALGPGIAPDAPATERGDEHVLVVDDEVAIVTMLRRMLEANGYRVTGFTSGEEAVAAFERAPDSFDVVITDQTMPRMTGVELARALRARRPELPVILTTGYVDRVDTGDIGRDVMGVTTKPFDLATLLRTLRGALERP